MRPPAGQGSRAAFFVVEAPVNQEFLFHPHQEELSAEALAAAENRRQELVEAAEQSKEHGKDLAAAARSAGLKRARMLAAAVAQGLIPHADGRRVADGLCTADDVRFVWEAINERLAAKNRPPYEWLANAAGSVFSGARDDWAPTGRRVKSLWKEGHGNLLLEWRYKRTPNKEGVTCSS